MKTAPLAIFDSLEYIAENNFDNLKIDAKFIPDYEKAKAFLACYRGSVGTFNSYRREIERLLHWSWNFANKTLPELRRNDIEEFLNFCQAPPKTWIGIKKATRYIDSEGKRIPNQEWRPFVITVSKAQHRLGKKPDIKDFSLSNGAIKEIFAILSTFFNYLLQEEYAYMNPIMLIRQKSKFIKKYHGQEQIRRLSDLQWQTVLNTVSQLADKKPETYERNLFIMTALYTMYLRISELAANARWEPKMSDFKRDSNNNWWFKTVGKGNKERIIAVSESMLNTLKRWRTYLNLLPLPNPADKTPLLPKIKGKGPITSTTYLREIVQDCFDKGIEELRKKGLQEEADSLLEATAHWLRHTGISDDVKRRPREHVRDDAGHSSSATTDKYIDIELIARHKSAKNKPLVNINNNYEESE